MFNISILSLEKRRKKEESFKARKPKTRKDEVQEPKDKKGKTINLNKG